METRIPPPVYMLVSASLIWLMDWWLPQPQWLVSPWNRAGWLLMASAILIDITSFRLFLRAHTTVNPLHPSNATRLVTTGTYRYTRNPMYLGMLIFLLGWAMVQASLASLAVLPLFVLVITYYQILPEERALEARFGTEYIAYKAQVRRWL